MGVTSSAKRGEARRAPAPPSHLKREVIGVILVALSLLTLLSLLSFVPGEPKVVSTSSATTTPPTHNLIGSAGAVFSSLLFSLIGGAAYLFPLLLGLLGHCLEQSARGLFLRAKLGDTVLEGRLRELNVVLLRRDDAAGDRLIGLTGRLGPF